MRWGGGSAPLLLADLHTLAASDTHYWGPAPPCPEWVVTGWNSLGQGVLGLTSTLSDISPPASSGWTWGPLSCDALLPGPTPPSLTSLGLWPLRKGPIQPRLSLHK